MLDHLGIQCAAIGTSASFYDAFLAPIGATRILDFGEAIGFGNDGKPDFWVGVLVDGAENRPIHVAFSAPDRARVRACFEAAVATGAEVLHEPRAFPEYHPSYYGAFVRDPDGNNVEVCSHAPE